MEVQVFGHLRVSSGRGEIELGGSKQQAVLLSLLVANGAVVSSDSLIDLVWGDAPPKKPNVTLRSYISHLRKSLEPDRGPGDRAKVLITRAPGYAIDPSHLNVDMHAFADAALAAIDLDDATSHAEVLAATSAAFALWPDDGAAAVDIVTRPLADFPNEVSRLTELHLGLSIRHYRTALADGRANETLASLQQAAASHPTSEEVLALRMTALYQVGRTADALEVFQQARRSLLDEYGLDPSPILTDLEQRILSNDETLMLATRPTVADSPRTDDLRTQQLAPVGRSKAFDQMLATLPTQERSSAGSVIVGPAGIGKSTLLHAFADAAAQREIAAVWGRCADTASAATLRPWKSVLRDLLERTSPDDVDDIFRPQGHDLALVLPELGPALGLDEPSLSTGTDISDAIARTLQRWSARHPLLICLEDLHWADAESLVVLHHVLDTIDPQHGSSITLVATWRDTDVAAEAAQSRAARTRHLADIGRAVGDNRIQLQGLDTDDIAELYRTASGNEPDPDAIERLAKHTGGNPLFVTELLRGNIDGSFEPTETIKDVVLRRLDLLPTSATSVLSAAALCHPSIDDAMLPTLAACDEDDLADCLEAALAARLIEESPSQIGRYRFTHDLLAETLAGQLRSRRRAELHAMIGGLLEKENAPVAEIAHHYLLGASAGTSLGAARFAHAAAMEADDLADFSGALQLIEQGLEALDLGPDAPALRIDMLIDKAQILKFIPAHTTSHATSQHAFDLAIEAGEDDLAIVAAMVYIGLPRIDQARRNAEWLGYWSPPDESVEILERSLELMPEDHRWRSSVILALSNQLFAPHHDVNRSIELARAGLARLSEEGRPRSYAEGLVQMASHLSRSFDHDERKAMLTQAVEIAEQIRYDKIELRARKGLIGIALDEQNLPAAQAQVDAAMIVAGRSDDPFVVMQAESMQISLDLLVGDIARANERISTGFMTHSRYGAAVMDTFGMQFFTAQRTIGEFGLIIEGIKDKLEGYDGPAYGGPLACMQARSGDLDASLATINRFTELDMTWGGEGVLQFMTPAFFTEAVVDLSIEHPEILRFAQPLCDALEPANDRMISLVSGADYPSIGSAYRGRLMTALGRTDEAEALFDAAVEHLSAINARPSLLWTRIAMAENLAMAGDPAAEQRLDELLDEATDLGMAWAIDWARPRIQQRLNVSG